MRRNKTPKRGRRFKIRLAQVLVAGGIGYALYGGHGIGLYSAGLYSADARRPELSPAESVALRFPEIAESGQADSGVTPVQSAAVDSTADAQWALLSPEPMMSPVGAPDPQIVPASPDALQAATEAPMQLATAVAEQPVAPSAPPHRAAALATMAPMAGDSKKAPVAAVASAAPAARRHVSNRPGYMLNDAQIASIKERLNLTPEQQQMWPAVEAALRNMAYVRAQQARAHETAAAQTAAVDPDTVQGLKSAAVPLIMSFNAEQKEEVRNLVHVMGLDQLASQF